MQTISKTFLEAFNKYPDVKDYKKYLDDKRLTSAEKKLLSSLLMVRNNCNDEAYELLQSIPLIEDEAIWAHHQLLLGIVENNKGLFSSSVPKIEIAIQKLKKYSNCQKSLFRASEHLFIVYSNLDSDDGMKRQIEFLESYKDKTIEEELCVLKFKLSYHLFKEDLTGAKGIINQIEKKKNWLSESQKSYYFIEKFQFHLSQQNFKACSDVLEEMKVLRKFYFTANYKFMKGILAFVSDDSPLYLYPQDFSEHPYLQHQIIVLKSLEALDIEKATSDWLKLNQLAPNLYEADFKYNRKNDLFALALAKLLKNLKQQRSAEIRIEHFKTKEEKLFHILKSGCLITKEDAYALIWGKKLETHSELLRINKLILRVKSKFKIKIMTKNGTIKIAPTKSSNVA